MKSKNLTNDELDAKILEILGVEDGKTFAQICAVLNINLQPVRSGDNHFREVDRGLQRLKKSRKIMFSHKGGWTLLPGAWETVNAIKRSVTKRLKAQKA